MRAAQSKSVSWLVFISYESYGHYFLKQQNTVQYLGCYLDSNLNGVSMVCRVLKNIKTKLNFLLSQSNYLNYLSRRLLYNALTQPHFDYVCTSWHSLLSKVLKSKLKISHIKCIHFCLELPTRGHVDPSYFRKINWPPVECRV